MASPPSLPIADQPEVVLAVEALADDLEAALALDDADARRAAIGDLLRQHPTYLEAWARLSEDARDDIERYAYARIGYHRGLDTLRGNGWRPGSLVRWSNPGNRGFLRALDALRAAAEAIGEEAEATRCADFLRDLDPDWDTRSS